MSIQLEKAKIEVKSHPWEVLDGEVWIGDHAIPMDEFCHVVEYVLQNTDLKTDDPRIETVEKIKNMGIVDGWMKGRARFGFK